MKGKIYSEIKMSKLDIAKAKLELEIRKKVERQTIKNIFNDIDVAWKRAKKDHLMTTDYNFNKELKEIKKKYGIKNESN